MITKEEALNRIRSVRSGLTPQQLQRYTISDQMGAATTSLCLLMQNPDDEFYQKDLDDPRNRESIVETMDQFTQSA